MIHSNSPVLFLNVSVIIFRKHNEVSEGEVSLYVQISFLRFSEKKKNERDIKQCGKMVTTGASR